jgi:hypothetical protein
MLTALSCLYQHQAGWEIDCAFVKKEKQNDYWDKWANEQPRRKQRGI